MHSFIPKITPRFTSRIAINALGQFGYKPFEKRLATAKSVQRDWLLNRIRLGEQTDFGKDHGFNEIRSIKDFQKRIPISEYERFEPYIQSVAKGKTEALIPQSEKLLQFTITTGSTGVPKLNPVTNQWLAEYRAGWSAWGLKLFMDHPDKIGSRMIQMAGTWDMGKTEGGYQISMVSALLARIQNPFLKPYYLIPEIVNSIADPVARHYVALRLSILEDVGWILLMNPGTMIRLAELGDTHSGTLIKDIFDGTLTEEFEIPDLVRKQLQSYLKANRHGALKLEGIRKDNGQLLPKDYWKSPVIGCWTSGTAGFQSRYLSEYMGDSPVRDMGLVTSEGRHTIPITDGTPSGVPAIQAGFYEYVPVDGDNSNALEGHELVEGERYRLIMTTSAGYYRFDIGDIVQCNGFVGEAPLIEFIQKSSRVGDLEGEKVTEHQVVEAAHIAAKSVGFNLGLVTAVPRRLQNQQPRYDFLVEKNELKGADQSKEFLLALDSELAKINFLWRARRNEGVLQSPHLKQLANDEWDRCISKEVSKRGTGDYQYKHPGLVQDEAWLDQFKIEETIEIA